MSYEIEMDLAKNPETSHEVLEKLAQSKDWMVREAVAGNKNTPEEAVKLLSKDERLEVKCAIAGREELSQEIQNEYLNSPKPSEHVYDIELALARNPHANPETLEKLSKMGMYKESLLDNPNSNETVFKKIASHADEDLKIKILESDNISDEIKYKLAESFIEDEKTSNYVLGNMDWNFSFDSKLNHKFINHPNHDSDFTIRERLEIGLIKSIPFERADEKDYESEKKYINYPVHHDTEKPFIVEKENDFKTCEEYYVKVPLDEYMEELEYEEKATIAHEMSDKYAPHSLCAHEEILKVFPYEEPKNLSPEDLEIYRDCAQSVHENLLYREKAEPKIYESLIEERKQASESEEQSMGR